MDENHVTYFAETDARNKRVKFGIKAKDRTKHVYVIGKTGMGKSTLLENMAVQDIQSGEGMCFIDPHGKTADLLLEYVPKERVRDVIHVAPFDIEYPISFNVLESVEPDKRHLVVSGLMSTFKKIWVDAWSARMEYILTNTLLALLECPDTTLLGVNRMLSDKEYRKEVISKVQDPSVKTFWTKEFANYTERMAAEAVPAIQNKIGQFTANPLIRNMIGQPRSSFDFRKAMDERKIVIINLSKGRIGDENMKLLGGMLVTKIYLAAMSRADTPDRILRTLPNFYLFVDEFQNFANASFADILSEARKYKLNLTIAHQYIEQMDEQVRAAVFGNVGTMIVFRVGATDAEILEKEFMPTFTIEDLVNLGFTQIYLKLMIDGLTSTPFSAVTLPPIAQQEVSFVADIVNSSREQFARPRTSVEAEIIKFHEPIQKASAPSSVKPQLQPKAQTQSQPKIQQNNITQPSNVQKSFDSQPNRLSQSDKSHQPFKASLANVFPPKQQNTTTNITDQTVSANSQQQNNIKPIVKPVSLDTLGPNRTKTDGKSQTKENVNALKNALQAALAKKDVQPQVSLQTPKPPETLVQMSKSPQSSVQMQVADTNKPVSSDTNGADISDHVMETGFVPPPRSTPNIAKPTTVQPTDSGLKPKEVPEEVLKNVLKVD